MRSTSSSLMEMVMFGMAVFLQMLVKFAMIGTRGGGVDTNQKRRMFSLGEGGIGL